MKLIELLSDSDLTQEMTELFSRARAKGARKMLAEGGMESSEFVNKCDDLFPTFLMALQGMHPIAAAGARLAILAIDGGLHRKFGIEEPPPPKMETPDVR